LLTKKEKTEIEKLLKENTHLIHLSSKAAKIETRETVFGIYQIDKTIKPHGYGFIYSVSKNGSNEMIPYFVAAEYVLRDKIKIAEEVKVQN
jgi:hypothetical protein